MTRTKRHSSQILTKQTNTSEIKKSLPAPAPVSKTAPAPAPVSKTAPAPAATTSSEDKQTAFKTSEPHIVRSTKQILKSVNPSLPTPSSSTSTKPNRTRRSIANSSCENKEGIQSTKSTSSRRSLIPTKSELGILKKGVTKPSRRSQGGSKQTLHKTETTVERTADSKQLIGTADSKQLIGTADGKQLIGTADSKQLIGTADSKAKGHDDITDGKQGDKIFYYFVDTYLFFIFGHLLLQVIGVYYLKKYMFSKGMKF